MQVFTLGHSNRPLEAFIQILRAYAVGRVVDIRTVPRSRHNPQFNRETLPAVLESAGIDYLPCRGLGGLRRPAEGSPNTGWRNASFRGFADYMQTDEFKENLEALIQLLSPKRRLALICAEALPWRCHRSLIADALLIRGHTVEHILSPTQSQMHKITPWARVEGLQITYP